MLEFGLLQTGLVCTTTAQSLAENRGLEKRPAFPADERCSGYSPVVATDRPQSGVEGNNMDFLYTWTGMAVMAVLLVALIGLLFYLRSQNKEE